MLYTRRHFLEAAGAGLAAAGLTRWVGCGRSPAPAQRLEGAPGVELVAPGTALPDYSHDLSAYLTRVANDARAARKRIIDGITTHQQVLDRQHAVVEELWTML